MLLKSFNISKTIRRSEIIDNWRPIILSMWCLSLPSLMSLADWGDRDLNPPDMLGRPR
ncbi:exported protein of unknown function [Pseudomonas inefficax]|uniref:Uncharacterized protein n=1 Tax=Pseudomonas inefficax TaxID=2078786 RepID=A0AAQ1P6K3_9PSED|nr:exported protein of unknown function [Pseudomonas inefficax]